MVPCHAQIQTESCLGHIEVQTEWCIVYNSLSILGYTSLTWWLDHYSAQIEWCLGHISIHTELARPTYHRVVDRKRYEDFDATSCLGLMNARANFMMTSSSGTIFRVTGPLCREFTGNRWIPLTRPVFDLCLNKWLSKQWRCRWFETPWRSLWRNCNVKFFLPLEMIYHRGNAILITPTIAFTAA